ncbi:MAG TPA: DUF4249 domain-containing protein [Saprospiraceae bacterium]|nr:DUF4249 domain-containing protein [Saprospiraceae bacterium]
MKRYHIKHLALAMGIALMASCNLSKDVEIDLPDYERQPVVECYLEPGKPFRLLLTRSYAFFDTLGLSSNFLQNALFDGAFVTISYNGQTDTLKNQLTLVPNPIKVFNYVGENLVPSAPGTSFSLFIRLPDGGEIRGNTTMLAAVPIDSIVVEPNAEGDTLARMLTYITDDQSKENFYRRLLNYSSLDSFPDQDFLVTDRFSQTPSIAFGTGYELKQGDTVFNTIFHVTRDYYDFKESVDLAVIGNLNPFAQPSPIKSNISGSANPVGIFTVLVFDRDTTIVEW